MNELVTPMLSQLPALPVEDVKQTVDKVGAYVDALAAAKRATTDQDTINEIDDQIRKYSAFKIRCQMELGERTAMMTTARGQRTDKLGYAEKPSKKQQLSELNLTKEQAWQNEQLIKPENRPIVEKYLERAETDRTVPTTTGALKEIKNIKESKKPHVAFNSKDDEWYTPSQYIEAARSVMGNIDLDPASNDFANKTVKAKTYFTEKDNGLKKEWFGNVWLNPPYSAALIREFADKVVSSKFNQAIVLVNNATDTGWFKTLVDKANAIVFTTGRIRFVKHDGAKGAPLQGQAFIYFGNNAQTFLDVFEQFGWGVKL